MLRIIYYDITENKARTKVSNLLESEGFDRVQYSVFMGKIKPNRWPKIWNELEKYHEKHCDSQDRIYSHIIEQDHFKKMSILGQGPEISWILHEIDVLFV